SWTGQALAGWIIDQVVRGDGERARERVLIQANRMKTFMLGPDGKPVAALILDLEAQTITQVDFQQRYYVAATVQEYVQTMRQAQQMLSGRIPEAMKQAPMDCREPAIEIRKAGQQATIAGYSAVRYDILVEGDLDDELWLAKDLKVWLEWDPRKVEQFAVEMGKGSPCGHSKGRIGLLGPDQARQLAEEGYPVRTLHRGPEGSSYTIEVVKVEGRDVQPSEFQPPAGFTRKKF
ncbi:MAG: DUF4412 domain-containing protein, partial [Candidatus Methylomirabilis sp.]